MSASMIQAWGDGLAFAQSGATAKFQINPNGQDMQGITFGVEGEFFKNMFCFISVFSTF